MVSLYSILLDKAWTRNQPNICFFISLVELYVYEDSVV